MASTTARGAPPHGLSLALQQAGARHSDGILLLGRLLIAYIFIESAIGHAGNLAGFAATFKNFQLPAALGVPVAALAVVAELAGGIALIVGYRVRETALLMILFLLFTIFVGHRFWEFEGPARRLHVIQIKKNVAMIGGFLYVFVLGAGRHAVSNWMAARSGVPADVRAA